MYLDGKFNIYICYPLPINLQNITKIFILLSIFFMEIQMEEKCTNITDRTFDIED